MAVIKTKRLSTKNIANLANLNNSRFALSCTNNKSTSYTGAFGVKIALPYVINYVVVAGGGAGGGGQQGGGGGAGGVLQGSLPNIAPGTIYSISVGGGGSGGTPHTFTVPAPPTRYNPTIGSSGSPSYFGPVTAIGGGRGGTGAPSKAIITNACAKGLPGGSGGGNAFSSAGCCCSFCGSFGAGTPGQGNNSGKNKPAPSPSFVLAGAGGGGAGAVGCPGKTTGPYVSQLNAGPGGAGITTSTAGIPNIAVGGGGGAGSQQIAANSVPGSVAGCGGSGGGGAGKAPYLPGTGYLTPTQVPLATSGTPGTPGTGGGGGGGSSGNTGPSGQPPTALQIASAGGSGGPGVVYVSALTACSSGAVVTGYACTGTNGSYTWWKFTSGGSFTA